MSQDRKNIIKTYGNKLRVRVMGICIENDALLLVKHRSLGSNGTLYAPPGGGMNFGESAEACLLREFREETGLDIAVEEFLFTHEFLDPPLHAIELFFLVRATGGELFTGTDPEMKVNEQIIQKVGYYRFSDLLVSDRDNLHHALKKCNSLDELFRMKGYHIFENKSLK